MWSKSESCQYLFENRRGKDAAATFNDYPPMPMRKQKLRRKLFPASGHAANLRGLSDQTVDGSTEPFDLLSHAKHMGFKMLMCVGGFDFLRKDVGTCCIYWLVWVACMSSKVFVCFVCLCDCVYFCVC